MGDLIWAHANAEYDGFRYIGYDPHTARRSEAKPVEFSGSKADSKIGFPLVRQPLHTLRGRIDGTGLQGVKIMLMGGRISVFSLQSSRERPTRMALVSSTMFHPANTLRLGRTFNDDKITFLSSALDLKSPEIAKG